MSGIDWQTIDSTMGAPAQSSGIDWNAVNSAMNASPQPSTAPAPIPASPGISSALSNIGMGALNGAADIGSTLLYPLDKLGITGMTPDARRAALAQFFQQNADPSSLPFKGGNLAADVAGTAGVGGVLGAGLKAGAGLIPGLADAAAPIINSIESGGLSLGADTAPSITGKIAQGITRVAGGAINGAATAGLVNPQDAGSGAVAGAILPAGVKALGAVGNTIKSAVQPFYNPQAAALDSISNFVNGPVNWRNAAGPLQPTADQLTSNPGIAAAAKAFFNTPEGKIAQTGLQTQNNQTAWNLINGIAGSDTAVQAAKDARATNAANFWQGNTGIPVPIDGLMTNIGALQKSGIGMNPQVRGALADISKNIQNSSTVLPTGESVVNADVLDQLRQNTSKYLQQYAPNGIVGSQEAVALDPLKQSITDTLSQSVPGYQNYLQQYAQDSVPINTMQVGRNLQDTLGKSSAGLDTLPNITPAGYRNALAQQLKSQRFGIDPQVQQQLLDLAQSYKQQQAGAAAIKSTGSDTILNRNLGAKSLYGNDYSGNPNFMTGLGTVAGAHLGGPFGALLGSGAGRYVGGLLGNVGKNVSEAGANLLMNPDQLKQLLSVQPPSYMGLMPIGRAALINATSP